MQQLTGLDAAFLAMETHAVFGHVGSVCVMDPSTSPDPVTLEKVTRLIGQRLHLMPPFRRRLVQVPLGLDQPYWIEDPDFDIEYHVRELALPAPGDDRQLADRNLGQGLSERAGQQPHSLVRHHVDGSMCFTLGDKQAPEDEIQPHSHEWQAPQREQQRSSP